MMGLGERFSKKGYSEYKPFVRVNTQPLIKKVLDPIISNFASVYVVCNTNIAKQLDCLFGTKIKPIIVDYATKGASETIHLACDLLPDGEQIACIDCDSVFEASVIAKAVNKSGSFILTFKEPDMTGLYSYIDYIDGRIGTIAEKRAISDLANAGFYVFRDKRLLKAACEKALESESEPYLSHAVNAAIACGEVFDILDVSDKFNCCGTPQQLKNYSRETFEDLKYTICFDVDGTLVHDLFEMPTPIIKNVEFCNEAYRKGCKIILHTARGMLSKRSDFTLIEAQRPYIESVLKNCGILYHELLLMKPYADLYIDDKAIPAHRSLEMETGLYLYQDHEPRSHHQIQVSGNKIIKYGMLMSESNYYNKTPKKLKTLFPKIYASTDSKIEMERLNYPTYSSLLLSKKLTKSDLDRLIDSLMILHQSIHTKEELDLSWAYRSKVYERFTANKRLYDTLDIRLEDYVSRLNLIQDHKIGIIHGDPVFTNVFLLPNGCKFIDIRGEWNHKLTILGDIYYDYAKVLQSLYGYDYVLHQEPVDHIYLQAMRNHYLDRLSGVVDVEQLIARTISLYLTLMPYHKDDRQ